MPEHLRALVVILCLATAAFVFAKGAACALACSNKAFEQRRNLWFVVTLTAFLAHNFWIFIFVTAVVLASAYSREENKLAMYFSLLFAVPMIADKIPGFGIVNYLFEINYVRLLSLVILFPAYLAIRARSGVLPFGRLLPDKFLVGYVLLNALLMVQVTTLTATMREGIFYPFIDIFLPYYVASRSLKNIAEFRDALMAFVVAALLLAVVGGFEFARHWLLYSNLDNVWGIRFLYGGYLGRGESLRALATTGQPIVLGYVMAVGLGFIVYLRKSVSNQLTWRLGLLVMILGIIVPLSRGPWVGALAILLFFFVLGPNPAKNLTKLALTMGFAVAVLLVSPYGKSIVDLLPFVGSVDNSNITYRQRLLDRSIQVILNNPFFGSYDFWSSLEDLKQGQGIIDMVNTYLGIGLVNGLVGLFLFTGFFLVVGFHIFKCLREIPDKNDELYVLGQSLLAVLLGIMIIIFTTSSILVIPIVYWSVAGLGVGYACLRNQSVSLNKAL